MDSARSTTVARESQCETALHSWHTYSPYKNLRGVTSEQALTLRNAADTEIRARPHHRLAIDGNNFALLSPRNFDSTCYGRSIWKIASLRGENEGQITTLLKEVTICCEENSIDLLTLDIDAADLSISPLLQRNGFYLAASKLTMIRYAEDLAALGKPLFTVRSAVPADLEVLTRLAEERLTESTLGNDPHLERKNSTRAYAEWIEKAVAGEWADHAFVAERSGKIKGFLSYRYDALFSSITGRKLLDNSGLAFAASDGVGAYVSLLDHAAIVEKDTWGAFVECASDNYTVQRFCMRRGYPAVGNRLIFHRACGASSVD